MVIYDLIIIGAGPAGMTAAIYAARANLKVMMLEKLAPGGQIINTHEIQNYTGFGSVNGAELAYKMFEHTQELQVTMEYATVTKLVNKENVKEIHSEEGQIYQTKAVLIATGTVPRRLDVENEERFAGENISWCAICDGAYYKDKDVVVVGGGNSAIEEAIYLASIAKSVKVVTLFNLTADAIECEKLKKFENVTIYEYHNVECFLGDTKLSGMKIKSVKTEEEIVLQCDGVFEYIGLKPSTEVFKEIGILDKQGYVEVDNYMATNVAGIYSAGDVTVKQLRQVVTACADGAIAAQAVAKYIENI
ncbi:MAG: NAD(P)/FAD-dependent oxidoreductase [Cellulosilyticaceae bacterium]